MNKTVLSGRMVKDPEITSSSTGTTFARFSIAVNRKFKRDGEPDADFFNCSAFGKTAEFIEKFFKKGSRIEVSGRLENNNYTNKEGKKIYDVRVMVEEAEFGDSKGSSQSEQSQGSAGAGSNNFLNIPDGLIEELDLPFS